MNKDRYPFKQCCVGVWEKSAICVALFLLASGSNAQTIVISSYGQGDQDAGIDVIQPSRTVTLIWSQAIPFSDVSIFVGLASFGSSGTGWATLNSGAGQVAIADFDYPYISSFSAIYGTVDLFDGLNLPAGTYDLTGC
jgi:hypothetical protein